MIAGQPVQVCIGRKAKTERLRVVGVGEDGREWVRLGVAVLMRMTLSIETRTSKNPGAVPQTSLPGTRAVDVTNAHRAGENLFISNLGSA